MFSFNRYACVSLSILSLNLKMSTFFPSSNHNFIAESQNSIAESQNFYLRSSNQNFIAESQNFIVESHNFHFLSENSSNQNFFFFAEIISKFNFSTVHVSKPNIIFHGQTSWRHHVIEWECVFASNHIFVIASSRV